MSKKMTDQELIAKADLTIQNLLDDGGALPPEMALQFYKKIMDEVTIFNSVRKIQMSRNEMRIPTIASAGRMLRVARNMYSSTDGSVGYDQGFGTPNRGLSKAERVKLNTGMISLKTDELIAVMYLTFELLEDVIGGGAIDNTAFQTLVLDIMAQQIALDLEEKLVLGDVTSGDDFLKLRNGIIAFATSNIVNQNNAPINHLLFAQMIKTLPDRYRSRLPQYKFYVNAGTEIDYRAQMAQRQTGMGDNMVAGTVPVTIMGVPMVRAGYMPTNTVVMTDPNNILFGIQRKFRLATDKDEEQRFIKLIVTMRVGQAVEQEDMMVKAINVGSFL